MDKLFRYVAPKSVLDIGANIGDFTRRLYYKFPECKVVMVEANPNCKPYLQLLEIPYDIVGLSNKEGYKDLYIEKINQIGTGASFYKENTEHYLEGMYDVLRVPVATLDSKDYYNGKPIDLIKIDVQGSELDIINGGENTLKNTGYVLLELSLLEYNVGSPVIEEVIDKMLESSFRIVDVVEYHRLRQVNEGAVFQIDLLFKRN